VDVVQIVTWFVIILTQSLRTIYTLDFVKTLACLLICWLFTIYFSSALVKHTLMNYHSVITIVVVVAHAIIENVPILVVLSQYAVETRYVIQVISM